jgi:diguanylate cyclase (GGDEF)-like protein/PAS domain S-box-containing protein
MRQKKFYETALAGVGDGVCFCDKSRLITYWNESAERITGYKAEEVRGSSCAEGLLAHVDAEGTPLCDTMCPLVAALAAGETRESEVFLHHKEGHRVPVRIRTFPVYDGAGRLEGAAQIFTDNSALLAALESVERLSVQADIDPLTGVGNRRSMQARIDAHAAERRRAGSSVGLLFIDIDHFKAINDDFGHGTGDRVLRMVAETIRHNLRTSDSLARWGGDEFLALLHRVDAQSLQALAEKLRALVASSFLILGNGAGLSVTVSIGGTLLRQGETAHTAVARADHLLYESKTRGRNRLTWAA